MQIDGMQVVIAGAGTGGAVAGLLLARAGATVTVFERVPDIRSVGAGIAIADNGMAVLDSLGLAPALADAPTADAPAITDAAGRVLLTPPRGVTVRLMRRSTLQRVLLDALDAEPRITLRLGASVVSADRTGAVRFREHGFEDTLRASLVIGADGVHSVVRATGGFTSHAMPGISYVRALVQAPATGVEAWTSAGIFGSFAVDGGTYLYASAGHPDVRAALEGGDLDRLRATWAWAYAPAGALLAGIRHIQDLLVTQVTQIACPCWHAGSLVLLGDAAHAMAPNLGQGANSAMVDASVLLDELRRAQSLSAALTAYDARRRPAVRTVATLAARLGAVGELRHAAARWVRDRVLMPAVQAMTSERDAGRLLQEQPADLRRIGRA